MGSQNQVTCWKRWILDVVVAKLEENRVQDVQKELLEQLYDIRQTLFEEFQSYQVGLQAAME